tara:strand:+ start:97801 stop:98070 length:270 start_codon:yes stop_codon:yes gene_type:complete
MAITMMWIVILLIVIGVQGLEIRRINNDHHKDKQVLIKLQRANRTFLWAAVHQKEKATSALHSMVKNIHANTDDEFQRKVCKKVMAVIK